MRFLPALILLFLAGLVLAAPPKVIQELTGKIVSVTDGDTVKVLVGKETITIRLEGIDAPESRQSFGNKAKQALSDLVFGKEVTVRKTGEDRYGRTLGYVLVGEMDANARMVEEGWAWHFKKYNDEEHLAKLEEAARSAKRGLWADADPLPPWEYRARQKSPTTTPGETTGQEVLFWLNTSSGVRHNPRCEHFQKTARGRACGPNEGKPCGICGG